MRKSNIHNQVRINRFSFCLEGRLGVVGIREWARIEKLLAWSSAKLRRVLCLPLFAPIALLILLSAPIVSAQENFIVTVGQDKVFTQFNYHNAWFENDPNDPAPWPEERIADAAGNNASVYLVATPVHAGMAEALVGVKFEWDLRQYTWEQVQNWPIKIIFDFSYQVAAYYTPGPGSNANAGVTLPPLTEDWYDWIGSMVGSSGTRSNSVTEMFTTTWDGRPLTVGAVESWGRKVFLQVLTQAQAHSVAEGGTGTDSYSSANVTINSIRIEFEKNLPETSILTGPSGGITTNSATFIWTGTDDVTPTGSLVYAYRLDPVEANFSAFDSSTTKTYSSLPNGSYTFYVKAKDQAGNEDPTAASRSFTVSADTNPPSFTWQGVFEAIYKPNRIPATSFIRGIWDIQVEARLEFDGTLPSGEYSRIYSVTSVVFKMPFEYSTYEYDPVTQEYSFVAEASLLELDSSDFDLGFSLDVIATFGGSFVADVNMGGISQTQIFLKHDARKVFTTAKGLELSLGGGTSGVNGGFTTVRGNLVDAYGLWPGGAKATPPEGYADFDWVADPYTLLARVHGLDGVYKLIRFLDADDENRRLVGAVADGAAWVIVEIIGVRASADVTFPDGDGQWATEPALGPNGVWRRTWQAPPDFGIVPTGEDRTRRPIEFQISVDGAALDPPPFHLYRAPVVLLHGFWAGAEFWASLESDMRANGYSFVLNYPYPNNASLETNKDVFRDRATKVLMDAHTRGVAARLVDVVGHSMGGLVAQYDRANSDFVRRIVTVGTPYCGSPLGDAGYLLGLAQQNPALADMRTGVCKDHLLGVDVMAINGIWNPSIGGVSWPYAGPFPVLYLGLVVAEPRFFRGEENDLVVSASSQKGLLTNVRDVPNTWHLAESTNSMVKSNVLDFLSMPLSRSAPWTTSGFSSAGQAEVASPGQVTVQNGTVTITSPAAGTVVSPGQLLRVRIEAPSGTRQVFVGMPNGRAVVAENPPFEVDLAVPVESLGNVSIGALAWDGITVMGLGTTDVRVVTTATVSSLAVLPSSVIYLGVGQFLPLRASATFSDGATRLVTSNEFGTTYESSKPIVASVTTEGVVTGLSAGYCVIKVRNGGKQVDIPVLVTPPRLPQLTLSLSGTSFQMGDTLILTATVTPAATPRTVDVYVAVQLPDGGLLFLLGDGSISPTLQPIVRSWPVSPFTGQIFAYTFTGGEPVGNYAWLAAFTEPGTLNFIGPIVSAPFSFSP